MLRRLQWRIAIAYTALVCILLGLVSIYLIDYCRDRFFEDLQLRLEHDAVLVGVVIAPYFKDTLDTSKLISKIKGIDGTLNTRITIVGRDGKVLVDTREDPLLKPDLKDSAAVSAALLQGTPEHTSLNVQVKSGHIYLTSPILLNGETVGVTMLSVPTSQFQGKVNRVIFTLIISMVAMVVLAVLLAVYLTRRSISSIHAVIQATSRISMGELRHQVYATSSDETRELAEAFNDMSRLLRQKIADLSGQRNQLSAVLATMRDGVALLDSDGRIVMANPAAHSLMQAPLQQGQRLLEVVRDHDLERIIRECEKTHELQVGEVELGSGRSYISVIATPLVADGTKEVLLVIHDLTQTRQVETMRREFVSNLSHELRTPLAAVKASAESLDTALDDPATARQFLERIDYDVDHMNRLVGDLLELSRMEFGQIDLRLTSVDIADVIGGAIERHRSQAEVKGQMLSVKIPGDLSPVIGDVQRLQQVVSNLVDNAVKFTPKGGVIRVCACAGEDNVSVSVADNGIGMSEEHILHVFERFYKIDRVRQEKGTGLGLSIAKHIVQLHGGEIQVKSSEGEGSTFTFTVQMDTTRSS